MKKNALLATALLLSTLALGQNDLRPWTRGPLTWSDFSVVDQSIGLEHSYLEYLLDIENHTQEIEGFIFIILCSQYRKDCYLCKKKDNIWSLRKNY